MNDAIGSGDAVDPRSLLDAGRLAWGAGRQAAAIRCWRMAAATSPAHAAAPYLNLARVGVGRPWVESVANAIAPGDPVVVRNLGVLAAERGAETAAMAHLRRALVLAPDSAGTAAIFAKSSVTRTRRGPDWALRAAIARPEDESGWCRLFSSLAQSGRIAEAERRAAQIPLPPESWSDDLLLIVFEAQLKSGKETAALPIVSHLVERRPLDPRVRAARAVLSRRGGNSEAAVREAMRAAVLDPGCFTAAGAIATEVCHVERYEQAVPLFERCLRIAPLRRHEVIENHAVSLQQAGRTAEGDRMLREVLVLGPDLAKSWQNMSTSAFRAHDLETAGRQAEYATLIDPGLASAQLNLAGIRRHQGRPDEARPILARAIDLSGGQPGYRFARAVLELGDGDPTVGVANFDARWEVPTFPSFRRLRPVPSLPSPIWNGDVQRDATLAVWGEQGVGDELWFAGYLEWAASRVGRVILEVTPHLAPLFARTFPGIDVRPRGQPETETLMASADLQIPLGSLMVRCGGGDRPVPTGYLKFDQRLAARLRAKYARGDARVVGVSWRSVKPDKRASFDVALAHWGPIFATEGVVFVSLQYGDVGADVAKVREWFGVDLIADAEVDAYRNLDDFAAQMAAMDVVVSIANSTVAMAHGLGKPVHALLRTVQEDWRYARRRETTRWLPTVRCSWQAAPGNWRGPVETVAARLRSQADAAARPD